MPRHAAGPQRRVHPEARRAAGELRQDDEGRIRRGADAYIGTAYRRERRLQWTAGPSPSGQLAPRRQGSLLGDLTRLRNVFVKVMIDAGREKVAVFIARD